MTTKDWLTLPNAISFARLLAVPVLLALLAAEEVEWALGVFSVAAASDFVDGLLARLFDAKSKLGGILDPVADKVLVLAVLGALAHRGVLPLWLPLLVLVRDALELLGSWVVHRRKLEIPASPSRIGKYATFWLLCLAFVGLAIGLPSFPRAAAEYVPACGFVAALCVVASTGQYLARFGYLFFERRGEAQ